MKLLYIRVRTELVNSDGPSIRFDFFVRKYKKRQRHEEHEM